MNFSDINKSKRRSFSLCHLWLIDELLEFHTSSNSIGKLLEFYDVLFYSPKVNDHLFRSILYRAFTSSRISPLIFEDIRQVLHSQSFEAHWATYLNLYVPNNKRRAHTEIRKRSRLYSYDKESFFIRLTILDIAIHNLSNGYVTNQYHFA